MRKGLLVRLRDSSNCDPYVVIRGPYEGQTVISANGRSLTKLSRCVDVLTSSGDIIKGIDCNSLERA